MTTTTTETTTTLTITATKTTHAQNYILNTINFSDMFQNETSSNQFLTNADESIQESKSLN